MTHEEQARRAAARAKGELLIVAQDGSGDARLPSEALAKAARGAVIEIERGEYKDFLNITKPVTLRAAEGADVTLTPVGPGYTEYDRLHKKVEAIEADRKQLADRVMEHATPYLVAQRHQRSADFAMTTIHAWPDGLIALCTFLPLVLIAVLVPISSWNKVSGFNESGRLILCAALSGGLSCLAVGLVCFVDTFAFFNDAGRRVSRVGHVLVRLGVLLVQVGVLLAGLALGEALGPENVETIYPVICFGLPLVAGGLSALTLYALQIAFADKDYNVARRKYEEAVQGLWSRAKSLGMRLRDFDGSLNLLGGKASGELKSSQASWQLVDEPRKELLDPALPVLRAADTTRIENLRFHLGDGHRGLEGGDAKVRFEVTVMNCAFETTSHDAVAIVNASQMCDLVLGDCSLTGGKSAVVASSGTVSISRCRIEDLRGDAVVAKGNARVDLSGCTLARGHIGLSVSDDSVTKVKDTTITRMVGYGVRMNSAAKGSSFHQVAISDCGAWAFAESERAKENVQSSALTDNNCADRPMPLTAAEVVEQIRNDPEWRIG